MAEDNLCCLQLLKLHVLSCAHASETPVQFALISWFLFHSTLVFKAFSILSPEAFHKMNRLRIVGYLISPPNAPDTESWPLPPLRSRP